MAQGRKGKYHDWITDEGLLKIEGWAKDGLTDKQIAHNMGVTEQTLNNWKKRFPSLFESLKKGKEVIDREVENALLKRALGYEYEEVTKETSTRPDGKTELAVTKVVTKQVVPDTTAQIFWLRNRKGKVWSNRDLIDADKIKADTEYTKEKTKLLQGEKKDLTHLEELFKVMRDD